MHFRLFRQVGDWLGQFPSLLFLTTYLALIPLCAFLYYFMPYDFYSSTVRYEPQLKAEKDDISKRLKQHFLDDKSSKYRNKYPSDFIILRDIPDFNIQTSNEGVNVIVRLIVIVENNPDVTLVVSLYLDSHSYSIASNESDPLEYVKVTPTMISDHSVNLSDFFPCHYDKWQSSACLGMTTSEHSELLSLSLTEQGLPTEKQSSYTRMLYFSAVTMSTLGYGDIVPITERARFLVTIQIFLGPVLIGLFFNALARESQHTPAEKSS
jgi:hypothetical protein